MIHYFYNIQHNKYEIVLPKKQKNCNWINEFSFVLPMLQNNDQHLQDYLHNVLNLWGINWKKNIYRFFFSCRNKITFYENYEFLRYLKIILILYYVKILVHLLNVDAFHQDNTINKKKRNFYSIQNISLKFTWIHLFKLST